MDTTALILWQSYLHTSAAKRQDSLLRCLSPSLLVEMQATLPIDVATLHRQENPENELWRIHSSWLTPFLRSLPENEIKLFLSCLDLKQIHELKHVLLLSDSLPNSSNLGKAYLKKTFLEMVACEEQIPISCLPKDPLNQLLALSYKELNSLIDLLSMHDLSCEIRQIIDTFKLKEIYGLLTKPQTTFLKSLLHKKEPVSFKKMGLNNWQGNKEELKSMLLQRGINRIAKSLYEKNPSLLWYVTHRLDEERGQLLIKLCTAIDHPKAASLICEQVIELMHSFKNTNPLTNL